MTVYYMGSCLGTLCVLSLYVMWKRIHASKVVGSGQLKNHEERKKSNFSLGNNNPQLALELAVLALLVFSADLGCGAA